MKPSGGVTVRGFGLGRFRCRCFFATRLVGACCSELVPGVVPVLCVVVDAGCFGLWTGSGAAGKATAIVVPAGSEPWARRRYRTSGDLRRPTVAPRVSRPQPPTDMVSPGVAATAEPSIARPVTVPLPAVAWTLLAVTAPPNRETDESVISVDLHVEPLVVEESKAITGADAG